MAKHRKMFARILRYIATMHHSLGVQSATSSEDGNNRRGNNNGPSFVGRSRNVQSLWQSFYFQDLPASNRAAADAEERWGVLFSTKDFQHLFSLQANSSEDLFQYPPFSFYAASVGQLSAAANRKRAWGDAFRNPLGTTTASNNNNMMSSDGIYDGKACWLRLTRLVVPESPSLSNAAVRRYLQQWRDQTPEYQNCESLRDILTLESLARAPKIAPEQLSRAKEIKTFLRSHKMYLRKKSFQQALEPMYNQLFEWIQQTRPNDELVWGLGHARMRLSDNTVVNGPLLEIHMEVELANDGALLVRPREHTGAALNREVLSALMSANDSVGKRVEQLHRFVAELDPLQIAPGQPETYIPFFKRLVVELSSGGRFQASAKVQMDPPLEPNKMLVTEAWCLYSRPKPSSVWARDATAFADQLALPPGQGGEILELPRATWALTHGPSALGTGATSKSERVADKPPPSRPSLISRLFMGEETEKEESPGADKEEEITKTSPIVFPLPASEAQDRIADLMLRQNYPAVVTEGPPGTGTYTAKA